MKITKITRTSKKTGQVSSFEYIKVAERVKEFHRLYPHGEIYSELLSATDADMVIMKTTVCPDTTETPSRRFTGHSQAKWSDSFSPVNPTSALENAETSAVGRALAFLKIGIVDDIASSDEIKKANVPTTSAGKIEASVDYAIRNIRGYVNKLKALTMESDSEEVDQLLRLGEMVIHSAKAGEQMKTWVTEEMDSVGDRLHINVGQNG